MSFQNLGAFRVANSAQGLDTLIAKLAKITVAGVVMEATGGYEQAAHQALMFHGINASIVNPARVRAFATGTGQLAKTDKIDAQILVHYAAFKKPAPTPLASTARAKLKNPGLSCSNRRRDYRADGAVAPLRKPRHR
ncbi:MAG: transposase [Hyphomicrobium sp.]|nr:transposase [Hyphomicrobium sp.]